MKISLQNIMFYLNENEVCINVHLEKDELITVWLLHLKRKSRKLYISNQSISKSLDELIQYLPKNCVATIYLSGTGIITKNQDLKTSTSEEIINKQIFNAINHDDFYFQTVTDSDFAWTSFVRKQKIDTIINNIQSKCYIKSINLIPHGPVNDLTKSETFFLKTQNKDFQFNANQLMKISLSNEGSSQKINVLGAEIDHEYLPSLFCRFSSSKLEDNINLISDKYQIKRLRIASMIYIFSSSLLFIILLANFLVFSGLYKDVELQRNMLNTNKQELDEIENLSRILKEQERFIKKEGLGAHTLFRYYIADLSSSIPENLSLKTIDINPLKVKSNKMEISRNNITLTGLTNDGLGVSKYMNNIKKFEWVKDVVLSTYKIDPNSGNSEFEIRITVKGSNG